MANEQRRHDLTDAAWAMILPHTIGNKGSWGGNARDTRLFVNGVFWILRTGAPWRGIGGFAGARQTHLGADP